MLDYGPLKAGLAFLPFTAGIMISAGLASQFAPKIGVRPVAIVGMIITAAGLLLLARIPVHGSYVADVMPSVLLTSLGMGAVFVPLTLVATTGLDLRARIVAALSLGPQPHAYRRIKKAPDGGNVLAVKAWRARFRVVEADHAIVVERILTGYRTRDLERGADPVHDTHRAFVERFG